MRDQTNIVMSSREHAHRVMSAITRGDDAEYRRLVFGYLIGDGYAVLASHHTGETNSVIESEWTEIAKKFDRKLYPGKGQIIPA